MNEPKHLYHNYVQTAQDKKGIPNLYQTYLIEFTQKVLVHCNVCNQIAEVKIDSLIPLSRKSKASIRCLNCANYKEKYLSGGYLGKNQIKDKSKIDNAIILGMPIDPYFHLELYLKIEFRNHILWVYNIEHLNALIDFINSKIKPNKAGKNLNASIGSRLPKWMLSEKNRSVIVKKLINLKMYLTNS